MCRIFHKNRVRPLVGGLATSLLLAALGCGSSTATVSGKIAYRNNPLHGGTVTFYGPGETGWTKTSTIGDDGSYKLDHVPKGSARISVETKTAKVNPMGKQMMPKMPKGAPPEGIEHSPFGQMQQQSADKFVKIPDKYKDPNQSGLTYEVTSGKQEHNIDLQ